MLAPIEMVAPSPKLPEKVPYSGASPSPVAEIPAGPQLTTRFLFAVVTSLRPVFSTVVVPSDTLQVVADELIILLLPVLICARYLVVLLRGV